MKDDESRCPRRACLHDLSFILPHFFYAERDDSKRVLSLRRKLHEHMATTFKEKIASALNAKASELARERGLHLLRIDVRGTEQNPVIEVLLDGDRLVAVADCEIVSRDLAAVIEADKLVKGNY